MSYHSYDLVQDNLYLGDRSSASDPKLLQKIRFILTVEMEPLVLDTAAHVEQMHIAIEDLSEADLLSNLEKGIDFISRGVSTEQPVLVHCRAGMSRSAAFVAAYLIKSNGWTLDQTLDLMTSRRPCVHPNEGFLRQLTIFEAFEGRRVDESAAAVRAFRLKKATDLETVTVPAESLRSHVTVYRCKKCRSFLASSKTSFQHQPGPSTVVAWHSLPDEGTICCQQGLFVQPHDWMRIDPHGGGVERLNCQKCNARVGTYSLSRPGVSCACGATMEHPSFIINTSKVDKCTMRKNIEAII